MAKMRLECPRCLSQCVVDRSRVGTKFHCRECRSILQVPQGEADSHQYKNCHYCGERVKRGALKCRHCLEYLVNSPNDPRGSDIVDEGQLSYKEILFCLAFTILGCFFGFVVATSNPRKGGKLIFTSLYGIALWFVGTFLIRLVFYT